MNTFAVTGWVVSIITLALVFFGVWYSHNMTKKRLIRLAKATMALQGNKDEIDLCRAIKEIDPLACPLLDYTIETKDGHTKIATWSANTPKPTKEQLRKILEELKSKIEAALPRETIPKAPQGKSE